MTSRKSLAATPGAASIAALKLSRSSTRLLDVLSLTHSPRKSPGGCGSRRVRPGSRWRRPSLWQKKNKKKVGRDRRGMANATSRSGSARSYIVVVVLASAEQQRRVWIIGGTPPIMHSSGTMDARPSRRPCTAVPRAREERKLYIVSQADSREHVVPPCDIGALEVRRLDEASDAAARVPFRREKHCVR